MLLFSESAFDNFSSSLAFLAERCTTSYEGAPALCGRLVSRNGAELGTDEFCEKPFGMRIPGTPLGAVPGTFGPPG